MKRIPLLALLLCLAFVFVSCSPSFDQAEKYGEKLQEDGYSVYIIQEDDSSAPSELLTLKFVFEHILYNNSSAPMQRALLASSSDTAERICVFYYETEKDARNAKDIIASSASELELLFGAGVDINTDISSSALRITVKEKTEVQDISK